MGSTPSPEPIIDAKTALDLAFASNNSDTIKTALTQLDTVLAPMQDNLNGAEEEKMFYAVKTFENILEEDPLNSISQSRLDYFLSELITSCSPPSYLPQWQPSRIFDYKTALEGAFASKNADTIKTALIQLGVAIEFSIPALTDSTTMGKLAAVNSSVATLQQDPLNPTFQSALDALLEDLFQYFLSMSPDSSVVSNAQEALENAFESSNPDTIKMALIKCQIIMDYVGSSYSNMDLASALAAFLNWRSYLESTPLDTKYQMLMTSCFEEIGNNCMNEG